MGGLATHEMLIFQNVFKHCGGSPPDLNSVACINTHFKFFLRRKCCKGLQFWSRRSQNVKGLFVFESAVADEMFFICQLAGRILDFMRGLATHEVLIFRKGFHAFAWIPQGKSAVPPGCLVPTSAGITPSICRDLIAQFLENGNSNFRWLTHPIN